MGLMCDSNMQPIVKLCQQCTCLLQRPRRLDILWLHPFFTSFTSVTYSAPCRGWSPLGPKLWGASLNASAALRSESSEESQQHEQQQQQRTGVYKHPEQLFSHLLPSGRRLVAPYSKQTGAGTDSFHQLLNQLRSFTNQSFFNNAFFFFFTIYPRNKTGTDVLGFNEH